MRTLLLTILLLPTTVFAGEIQIAVGMNRSEAVALITKHGGADITPGMAVVGPKGEWPLTGIYWMFRDYDAVIGLYVRDDKVTEMAYWSKKDFGESKQRRAQTELSITALKIDTTTKEVSIEKTKPRKDAG